MTTNITTAENHLAQLGIKLPEAPEPFGTYAEAVQTGNLLTRRFSMRLAPIFVPRECEGRQW